ncbi:MAG: CoA ester lyase [Acidobacteriota bacterium]
MSDERPCRSYLFAPGNNERLLGKVLDAGADAVVLDLEDAVAAEHKLVARQQVRQLLQEADATLPVWVRLNDLRGAEWQADVAEICGEPTALRTLAGLRVPKAESAAELAQLDETLRPLEEQAGLEPGSSRLTCTIESALGLVAAPQLAAHPRVSHLAFGEADFVADIGAELDGQGTATLFARSSLVVAARAAGIAPPIAPVFTQLDDPDGLRRSTRELRQQGFFGRSCIHPRQIEPIHHALAPRPEQIAQARAILASFEEAGGGSALAAGRFVDEAVVRQARAVLALAETPNGAAE